MILVKQEGNNYLIKFKYDPEIIELIKQVPGRRWVPEDKVWLVPSDRLGFLIATFKATKFEKDLEIQSNEHLYENEEVSVNRVIPQWDLSDVNFYVEEGHKPFSHQLDAMKYYLWRIHNGYNSGFLLADEPGCISGQAIITILEDNCSPREVYLNNACKMWKSGQRFEVLSFNEKGNVVMFMPMIDILDKGVRKTLTVYTENNSISCTPDHEILTTYGWIAASSLSTGDEIYVHHGAVVEPQKVEKIKENIEQNVYDIMIDDEVIHNFLANGVVVHNCGKTLEIMNIAMWKKEHRNSKHCLIIACVNSAKYNWVEDIIKHTNGKETPYILGSRLKRNGSINYTGGGAEKLKDLELNRMYGKEEYEELPYFIVMNIESLRTKSKKTYTITQKIIEMIDNDQLDIIALDEIHKNASPSSIQGQQILKIKNKIKKNIEWFPMTGTPITSKPTDVYLPLRLVNGHSFTSFYIWCEQFCVKGGFAGKDIIGYKNIPYLKNLLQPNMLRRLKNEVLDLPPKIHHTEYVENTPFQNKLYQKTLTEIINNRENIISSINPLAMLLRLRQVNGSPELVDRSIPIDKTYLSKNAKFHRALELIDEIVDSNEKVIVFSNWVEPLRTFYRFISVKHKVCCYTGTMKSDKREEQKSIFINNPNYKIMIGTIGALGTSHTLTVASNIIFLDEPWNSSDRLQAEDRCVRPGQTKPINIYTLITKDTIDEKVHDVLSKKETVSKFIVDNELDISSNTKLFDMLVN